MRVEMDIDDGSSLMRLLHMLRQSIEDMQQDVKGIYDVLHSLSDVATEHLGAAKASTKDGETIWY